MLSEIAIENVAVIEKASVSFAGGFTVLTGETGAGKSILIDSINTILGSRTSRDLVRSGTARARVTAAFEDPPQAVQRYLEGAGYTPDAGLLLGRDVSAEGKSTCRVNGVPATAGILRDICDYLVNIHGQHDNQALLDPARHIEILDIYAKNALRLDEYTAVYAKYVQANREIRAIDTDETQKKRRMELLQYEVDEIEAADIQDGEEEALLQQRDAIRNAQKIIFALQSAHLALNGDDDTEGAVALLAAAFGHMGDISGYNPQYEALCGNLTELYYNASEAATEIGNLLDHSETDYLNLESIESRLDLLYRLKTKYGGSIGAVLAHLENAQTELESIRFAEERLAALHAKARTLGKEAGQLAAQLSAERQNAFKRLCAEIADKLAFLNMPGVSLSMWHEKEPLGPRGEDNLFFLIAANPGEPPKPLSKIASGGELARIMLAIKACLAEADNMPTVIYDEIDTGISGLAAGRIGQMLRSTAKGRQVICVTHTAQVAAYAHQHLLIEKKVQDGRTYTMIRELSSDERVDELARIISGDQVTDTARANAREMLLLAQA